MKRQASESLAGRIIYHELSALNFLEITDIDLLWNRGGYPLSYLAKNNDKAFEWRLSLVATYLERDIPQLGIRVPSIQLHRFWEMLAHMHGQLWNASKIASSFGITAPTARHYLDILNDTYIIRQLLPFFPNIKKRIVKSPKIYIRDSGLLHCLLGIDSMEKLLGHPAAGASWEGFIIEQICCLLSNKNRVYFYRTSAGAEVDLIITEGNIPRVSIEIKRTLSPAITRGLQQAIKDIGSEKNYIIYPGSDLYSLSENVTALPFKEIERIIRDLK